MSGYPVRGQPITADWAREVARAVSRCRIRAGHGLRLTETPNGAIISLAQRQPAPRETTSWPFGEHFAFGLRIAGAAVTVYPGALEAGGSFYDADAATITITADGQYIGLAFNRDEGTLAITGPHASRPVSDAYVYRSALYCFSFNGVSATLSRECINDLRLEAIT